MLELLIVAGTVGVILVTAIILAAAFRIVVSTNDVHIVQSAKRTVSYGKGEEAGNTYYQWPSWIPVIGIKVISLPVSVFAPLQGKTRRSKRLHSRHFR